ncbi:MAG TPA: DinB family protein [Pyrinomonadaceae bacterium]|nr:DinB family protein [Pyrinomonadaceae bacterium]
MNTIEHLRELLAYDRWADQRTMAALETAHSDKALRIFAHLLITKQEYLDRFNGKDSTGFNFWPELDLAACRRVAGVTNDNYNRLIAVADETALNQIVKYNTSEGVPHENSIRDLLTHVLLHSSIHRGNIVLKMREEGLEPPKIDYILYLRSKNKD